MALTLKDDITTTQTTIDVNGTDTLTNGDMYSLDDEYVLINTADLRSIQPGETAYQRVSLDRGVLGTRKATHAAGTTLTAVNIASGGGGGGVTVDNTVDAPFAASTLIAPGATESAPDEATLPVSVLSRTTALTNAQLIALPTTPVTVVPAPGADKMLLLVAAILRVDTSQNGYDNFDPNGDLLLHPEGEISAPHALLLSQQMEDLLSAFDNVAVLLHPYTVANTTTGDAGAYLMPGTFSVADTSNKAMQLSVNNQALGNFTDGNAANTGSVTVVYTIVTL